MARNSMETIIVPCGTCGAKLTTAEVLFLWSDADFLEHGGHTVHIMPEDEPTYWAVAKELARTA